MEKEKLIALIRKSQSGDAESIEKLLAYAHTSVSYQCRKMLKNQQDAEDMTQEVLVAIYTKLDTLQEPAAFHKWVSQITASRCINAINCTHVEYQFAEDDEGHSILDTLEELDEQVIPDKAIDNAETARMIEEIISALPDAQRAATLMFYYGEMTVKEIAKTMQVSENTVKSRLSYARKAIKEKVLDYEKQGVKLYGLCPLPFLLYFLRMAAQSSADTDAAGAMVAKIMAAKGTAAGMVTGTATARVAATAAGGTAGAGFFAGISAKVIAGILAAVITVGGIAAAVVTNIHNTPTEPNMIPTSSADVTEVKPEPTFPEEVATTQEATEPNKMQAAETATEPTETLPEAETDPAQNPTEPADNSESANENVCSACQIGSIVPVNLTQDPCASRLEVAFQCDYCGAISGYSYPPGNGHTVGISEDGYYEVCTVCGLVLGPTDIGHGGVTDTTPIETEPPAVSEHTCNYEIIEIVDRTCTEAGCVVATCTICGDIRTQYLNVQGHIFTDGVCSVCGLTENSGL